MVTESSTPNTAGDSQAESERGYRAHARIKGGFRIGLYQCKQVAEAHGGRLKVKSAEGRGTTCILRLPIDVEAEVSEMSDRVIVQGQSTS